MGARDAETQQVRKLPFHGASPAKADKLTGLKFGNSRLGLTRGLGYKASLRNRKGLGGGRKRTENGCPGLYQNLYLGRWKRPEIAINV